MNKYLTALILLTILCASVFAASPTFTGVTTCSNEFIGADRNYYDFDANFLSGAAADVDGDLNTSSCEVTFDAGATWITDPTKVFFNSDTNKCWATVVSASGYTDNAQVGFRISDNASADALTVQKTWWLDNNAPSVTPTITEHLSHTHIVLTSTDVATNVGNGSGFNVIYYAIDGGVWNFSLSNPDPLQYNSPPQSLGTHTLHYYVLDQFDNNSGFIDLDFNIFGTPPTIADPTTNDRNIYMPLQGKNFYAYDSNFLSGAVSIGDMGDRNADGCEVLFRVGGTWISEPDTNLAFRMDTNKCAYKLTDSWGYFDLNVKWTVWDNNGNSATSGFTPFYLDNVGPTQSITVVGDQVTLTCTDHYSESDSDPVGGVGTSAMLYLATNPYDFNIVSASTWTLTMTPGQHTVMLDCVDRFGNYSPDSNYSSTFIIGGLSPSGCGLFGWLVPLIGILLIFFVISQLLSGNVPPKVAVALCVGAIIGVVIINSFASSVCVM